MNTEQNNSSEDRDIHSNDSNRYTSRQQRREERRAARANSMGGSWILGAILIVIGVIIMLQNYTSFTLNNWWALFILIPAIGAFGTTWRIYQNQGRLTASARASLIGGIVLTMVTAIFLFNLNWSILGPVLLMLAGVGLILNVILPS